MCWTGNAQSDLEYSVSDFAVLFSSLDGTEESQLIRLLDDFSAYLQGVTSPTDIQTLRDESSVLAPTLVEFVKRVFGRDSSEELTYASLRGLSDFAAKLDPAERTFLDELGDELAALAKSSDERISRRALSCLYYSPNLGRSTIATLLQLLDTGERRQADGVMRVLVAASRYDERVVDEIVPFMSHERDHVRLAVARNVHGLGHVSTEVVEGLLGFLKDDNTDVRKAALASIGHASIASLLSAEDTDRVLNVALNPSERIDIRVQALRSFGRLRAFKASPRTNREVHEMRDLATDADYPIELRVEAVAGLPFAEGYGQSTVTFLGTLSVDADAEVATTARWAIDAIERMQEGQR
jgi:HEAT repeat protein